MARLIMGDFLSVFSKRQQNILSAALVIMMTVFLSRILGLVRDRLLASFFSVADLGIYFAAFRLPNLLFELIVLGTLSSAFIPVFTSLLTNKSKKDAFQMAGYIINLSIVTIILLAIPLLIFTKQLSLLLVPGFSEAERNLMVQLTRLMLLVQLMPLVVGNFVTGMLQSFQRFLIPSLAPIVYNLGIILGVVFLSTSLGLVGPVVGVMLGAVFYLLIQVPLLTKLGYEHRLQISTSHQEVRRVIKLMLPRTFGLAVSQIDTTVDLILASFLGTRSITIFYFAQHLQQLPIGLFGVTFAQAALPSMSVEAVKKNLDKFKQYLTTTIQQTLFFVLPTSTFLIVLRTPIVRLAFGTYRFDWEATVITGRTLSFFAISIFAQSLVHILARAFYALQDTKTPVAIGIFSVLVNTLLSIWFVSVLHLSVWSLALSASIASIVNFCLLLVMLYQKVDGLPVKKMLIPTVKISFASLVTGLFLYLPVKLFDQLIFDTTHVIELVMLTAVASIIGLSVYIFLAWFLSIDEVGAFFRLLQKAKRVPKVFFTQSHELIDSDQPSVS